MPWILVHSIQIYISQSKEGEMDKKKKMLFKNDNWNKKMYRSPSTDLLYYCPISFFSFTLSLFLIFASVSELPVNPLQSS